MRRGEIAVDAPQGEGFDLEGSFFNGGFREVVHGQPSDICHEQLIEASRVFRIAEGFYDMIGVFFGSGHD